MREVLSAARRQNEGYPQPRLRISQAKPSGIFVLMIPKRKKQMIIPSTRATPWLGPFCSFFIVKTFSLLTTADTWELCLLSLGLDVSWGKNQTNQELCDLGWGTQLVEGLPIVQEVLGSFPSTA